MEQCLSISPSTKRSSNSLRSLPPTFQSCCPLPCWMKVRTGVGVRIKVKESAVLEANFQNVRGDEILSRSVFLLLCSDQVLDC